MSVTNPQGCTLSEHYDFATFMSVMNALSNVSIETTLETMLQTLTKKTIKQIVCYGIKGVMMNMDANDQTFQSFKNKLNKMPKQKFNDLQNQVSQTSFVNQALNIESIKCLIFSYLKFNELIHCQLVNNQWLKDAFNSTSVYEINTANVFRMKMQQHQYPHYPNINRFKQVKSLIVTAGWREEFNHFFEQLIQFKNLVKLTLIGHHWERWTNTEYDEMTNYKQYGIISKLIQNNANTLEFIEISDGHDSDCTFISSITCWESITLPKLKVLHCTNNTWITHGQFTKGANKLEKIKLIDCQPTDEFWTDFVHSQNNLDNVRELIFTHTEYEGHKEQDICRQIAMKTNKNLINIDLGPTLTFTAYFYYFSIATKLQSITIALSPALYTQNIRETWKKQKKTDFNLNLSCLQSINMTTCTDYMLIADLTHVRNAVAGIICCTNNETLTQTSFIQHMRVSLTSYCHLFSHINFKQLRSFHSGTEQINAKTLQTFQNCTNHSFWYNLQHLKIGIHDVTKDAHIINIIASCLWEWQSYKQTKCTFVFHNYETEHPYSKKECRHNITFGILNHLNIVPHIQVYYNMIEDHNDIDHTWHVPNTRIWIKYTTKTFHIGVG